MSDDSGPTFVLLLSFRPPGMTDEEFLELCYYRYAFPQRMIFGSTE
ncbi:hypothetical protein [Dermacoccus sp. UBA1591]|nr:hypothetical protein [Dermacoccus sp. UBA1591]